MGSGIGWQVEWHRQGEMRKLNRAGVTAQLLKVISYTLFIYLCIYLCIYLFIIFKIFNVYFWETGRDTVWAGWGRERERERERERGNLKQASCSELSAQSLMWGSNWWTWRSWPDLKWDVQPTEPPRWRPGVISYTVCESHRQEEHSWKL